MAPITIERAERIAKAHPCLLCGEYSYKKVNVKPADAEHTKELDVRWKAAMLCGVCGARFEIGIDAEGDVVYEG